MLTTQLKGRKAGLGLAALFTVALGTVDSFGQGCVAARGTGICKTHGDHGMAGEDEGPWEGVVSYRWLKSDRHFVGDREQTQRKRLGNNVINDSNYIDLGLNYYVSPRVSLNLGVPFVQHDRSQTYTDPATGRLVRYHNSSGGLGDIRLGADYWVMDLTSPRKWNVLVGLSVDAPTGESATQGTFYRSSVAGGVTTIVSEQYANDQSVQPGDEGWGITPSIYFYHEITERMNFFVNGSYTITPQERNDTLTGRGRFVTTGTGAGRNTAPVPVARQFERYMSITDSYLGRLGVEYTVMPKHGLTLSLANRIEGVPVYDVLGGSREFRRPGYSISLEPGVMARLKGWQLGLYTPVAYYNNREKSTADIQRNTHGDAAFADFQVLFSVARRF